MIGSNSFDLYLCTQNTDIDYDVYRKVFTNQHVSKDDFLAISIPEFASVFSVPSIEQLFEDKYIIIDFNTVIFEIRVEPFVENDFSRFFINALQVKVLKNLKK